MIRFNCDYSEGAHERILKKLAETNLEQTPDTGRTITAQRPQASSAGYADGRMQRSISWWEAPRPI